MSQVDPVLIEALQNTALYPHPVEAFQVVETHISWVLLTGPFAYKIKKPLELGFLDFSTLEKRRFYCHEELRLNRRLAPDLYLDVVPITGSPERPQLNGSGPTVEYAVKMVQFPQEAQLDCVLERGELTAEHIDRIARLIADFHLQVRTAGPDSPYGGPERIRQPVVDNFDHIRDHVFDPNDLAMLNELEAWSERTYASQREDFDERKRGGFIRECHGDMHLRNMALLDDEILVFDCIEFNENLHWIDVMSEIAFLDMDLEDRGQPALARRFLNTYLEITGDYAGLKVLRYYQVYRAMVRAKVATIRLGQPGLPTEEKQRVYAEFRSYLRLADGYVQRTSPHLIVTHGLSGSGKTTYTKSLVETLGAIRIRSDVERKRLFGLTAETQARAGIDRGIYTREAGLETYARLEQLAELMVRAGYRVIVDAACLQRVQRDRFRHLAERLHVPFTILAFEAEAESLRQRVSGRERAGLDASDAGLAVLERQLSSRESIAADEQAVTLVVDTDRRVNIERLTAQLNEIARQQ